MRIYLDTTCARCGHTTSITGLTAEAARDIAATHVCADGEAHRSGEPVERIVPGPGEKVRPCLHQWAIIDGLCSGCGESVLANDDAF